MIKIAIYKIVVGLIISFFVGAWLSSVATVAIVNRKLEKVNKYNNEALYGKELE